MEEKEMKPQEIAKKLADEFYLGVLKVDSDCLRQSWSHMSKRFKAGFSAMAKWHIKEMKK